MASAYGQAGIPVVGGLFPGRAAGGPVSAGAPYMVGENGPELFVPRTSGAILPNGGTGGVQVNIYGSVLSTQRELAMLVEDAITRTYRQHGNRQPV
jgi:phage-related minor tail protein